MGIIQKQTIQGTFYSYVGIIIGFLTQAILLPRFFLTPAQIGLLGLLISGSIILAQITNLGINGAGGRYFPYFRNYEQGHNGFLLIACLVSLVGFLICVAVLFALRPLVIERYGAGSPLFAEYYYLLIPLTLFTVYFNLFDNYAKLLYDSVTGTFLQQFALRLLVLLAAVVYGFSWVTFGQFLGLWLLAYLLPTLLMAAKIIRDGNFTLSPRHLRMDKPLRTQLIRYASLTVLTGLSSQVIVHIDKYLVNDYYGLTETGIYQTSSHFGAVIAAPALAMYKVAGVVIADAWKTNDLKTIRDVYEKSCLNQLIIGCLVFVGIAVNLPLVMQWLPTIYETGYYVILWLGVGKLIDMATGVNGMILQTSRYYLYDSVLLILLVFFTPVITYLLMPAFGLTGVGIGAVIATVLFNTGRTWFVWYKFRFQPFSWRNAAVLGVTGLVWGVAVLVPYSQGDWWKIGLDLLVRSAFITVTFVGLIYFLNLSPDLTRLFRNTVSQLSSRFPLF